MEKIRKIFQKNSNEKNSIKCLGLVDEIRTELDNEYKQTIREVGKWKDWKWGNSVNVINKDREIHAA